MKAKGNGSFLFFLASAGVNVLNFVFHVLVSRSLGPDAYSALGALLAVILVMSVPLSALQLACAQAQARAPTNCGIGKALRLSTIGACAVLVLSFAAAPAINSALHLQGRTLAVLVGGWLATAIIVTVPQGVLVGGSQMSQVAIATFVGTGLSRVAMGAAAGSLGAGVQGAMLATVVGQAITLILLLVPLRSRLGSQKPQLQVKVSDSLLSVGALTGLAAFTAVDTVFARNTLPSRQAGIYVASATAGRITLFIPGAIALIAFPRFAAAAERGESASRLLTRSAVIVLSLGVLAAAFLSAFPHLVVKILFGIEYDGAAQTLPTLALAGAALGTLSLFSYFHIAHRSWASLIGWGGAALVAVSVGFHTNLAPTALAQTMLGIAGACLLLSISAAILTNPPPTDFEVRVPAVDLESGSVIPAPRTTAIELQ